MGHDQNVGKRWCLVIVQALSLNAWLQVLALLLTSCVAMGKFLNRSVPEFSFLASEFLVR